MDEKLRPSATPHPKKLRDGKLARVGLCTINASFRGEGEITFSFFRSQINRWKITDTLSPQRKKIIERKNEKKHRKIARLRLGAPLLQP